MSAEEFPLDMRAALQDQHSADVIVTLLTFTRPGESEPVRVSTDKTEPVDFSGPVTIWGTRSRGEIYHWMPISVLWPAFGPDVTPAFRISADMIDREIVKILRTSRIPADCKVELVRAADPDFVVRTMTGFKLRTAPWNDVATQMLVRQRAYDTEPYPCGTMNPTSFPGLFP